MLTPLPISTRQNLSTTSATTGCFHSLRQAYINRQNASSPTARWGIQTPSSCRVKGSHGQPSLHRTLSTKYVEKPVICILHHAHQVLTLSIDRSCSAAKYGADHKRQARGCRVAGPNISSCNHDPRSGPGRGLLHRIYQARYVTSVKPAGANQDLQANFNRKCDHALRRKTGRG